MSTEYNMIRTDYKVALLYYDGHLLEQPLTKSPSTIVHLYAYVR
jgi:hypothetical protein